MDIVCGEDPSYVYRAFPCIKALYGRLNGDFAYARTLLPIAQFYLNHSEYIDFYASVSVMYESQHLCLFSQVRRPRWTLNLFSASSLATVPLSSSMSPCSHSSLSSSAFSMPAFCRKEWPTTDTVSQTS